MDINDLVNYCGTYCGLCARYHGYTAFRKAVSMVSEIVDAHGFQYWMPTAVKDFNYTEFRKGLTFFSDAESWLVCRGSCKSGDGRPDCPMRDCCREKKINICFDCTAFPCDKVGWNEGTLKRAREYKKLGKEKWLQIQIDRAKKGFELHTSRCYQVRTAENLPE
jgi:hypothetical protein